MWHNYLPAVLVGDRLVMRGDFSRLSSPLRDYATDPVTPPNPNITSAVHIHQGDTAQNGPFQYALTVMLDNTGLDGRFAGDYTLTSAQLQALSDGNLYVDIHTSQNRAGELRGISQLL
jgi:CHRD domain